MSDKIVGFRIKKIAKGFFADVEVMQKTYKVSFGSDEIAFVANDDGTPAELPPKYRGVFASEITTYLYRKEKGLIGKPKAKKKSKRIDSDKSK